MNTAGTEWAERVKARNAIETAKAQADGRWKMVDGSAIALHAEPLPTTNYQLPTNREGGAE